MSQPVAVIRTPHASTLNRSVFHGYQSVPTAVELRGPYRTKPYVGDILAIAGHLVETTPCLFTHVRTPEAGSLHLPLEGYAPNGALVASQDVQHLMDEMPSVPPRGYVAPQWPPHHLAPDHFQHPRILGRSGQMANQDDTASPMRREWNPIRCTQMTPIRQPLHRPVPHFPDGIRCAKKPASEPDP
jgi:hypothetical protein